MGSLVLIVWHGSSPGMGPADNVLIALLDASCQYNLRRSNPCEKVLNVTTLGSSLEVELRHRHHAPRPQWRTWRRFCRLRSDATARLNANRRQLWSYTTVSWCVIPRPPWRMGWFISGRIDFNVYALNASTGALLWSYTTGACVNSSPAVANGVVYVGSYDHNVYALNASTGAKLWSYTTGNSRGFLARRGEWSGLCRLVRRQRVRAER